MAYVEQNEVAVLPDGSHPTNRYQYTELYNERQETASKHPAKLFLQLLDPTTDQFCFRTFDDTGRGREFLAQKVSGTFTDCQNNLKKLNGDHAGVFVVINRGGQTKTEINKIRAVFADTDGALLEPLLTLKPHIVIQSSPGKWHVYWLVDDLFGVDKFTSVQEAIAAKYGTDKNVKDLPRVMRLPGFNHCKNTPVKTELLEVNEELPRYSYDDIVEGLGLTRQNQAKDIQFSDLAGGARNLFNEDIEEGGRNSRLLSYVGSLRASGVKEHLMLQLAETFNLAHCKPPLASTEVSQVVNKYACQAVQAETFPDGVVVFTDTAPSPRDFTVKNLFMAGKSAVLAGLGGVSKTQLTIQAAISIAMGTDFLGRKSKEGAVLMLLGEEDEQEIVRRFSATAAHMGLSAAEMNTVTQRVRAYPMIGIDMRLAKIQGGSMEPTGFLLQLLEMASQLKQESGADVHMIVLDHVGLIHGGDFNAREDVNRTVSIVNELADRTGAAVILLAHSPKSAANSEEPSSGDVAGSASWVDNTRASFILKTMSEEEAKRFAIPQDARKQYVSLSSVKGNYIPADQKMWLLKVSMESYETTVLEHLELQVPARAYPGANLKLRSKIKALVSERTFLTRNGLERYSGKDGVLGVSKDKLRIEIDSMLSYGMLGVREPTAQERLQHKIKGKTDGILVVRTPD